MFETNLYVSYIIFLILLGVPLFWFFVKLPKFGFFAKK